MIVSFLIKIVNIMFWAVETVMPKWKFSDEILMEWSSYTALFTTANGFFPLEYAIGIFFMIVAFELTVFGIRIAFGFLSILRGGGEVKI